MGQTRSRCVVITGRLFSASVDLATPSLSLPPFLFVYSRIDIFSCDRHDRPKLLLQQLLLLLLRQLLGARSLCCSLPTSLPTPSIYAYLPLSQSIYFISWLDSHTDPRLPTHTHTHTLGLTSRSKSTCVYTYERCIDH